jgi:hypothetical protein
VNLADLLATAVESLNAASVPFMVTGSLASSFHGEPRATNDLDIVIDPTPATLHLLVAGLQAGDFSVDAEAAGVALAVRSQFNAIGPDAWKVDFIIRKDRPFSREEFGRRQPADLLGTAAFIASAEDMVVAKIEWAAATDSDRQLRDVAAMMEVGRGTLDLDYIEKWIAALEIRETWEKVAREAHED